jgi:hypothetical protein
VHRRLVPVLASVAALALPAVACEAFDNDAPVTPGDPDGDASSPGPDGAGDGAASDAGSDDADGSTGAACSRLASAPRCQLDECTRRTLHEPPAARYPFDIVTDATHVYWVSQEDVVGGGDGYNGFGAARIARVPKVGGPAAELARNQRFAVTLALEGEQVFWTDHGIDNVSRLWSVARTAACDNQGCPSPALVGSFPPGHRIYHLRRAAGGLLVGLSEAGSVFRVQLPGAVPFSLTNTSNTNPVFAVTAEHVYAGASNVTTVTRVRLADDDVDPTWGTVPPGDAGPGAGHMVAGCEHLWVVGIPAQGSTPRPWYKVPLAGGTLSPFTQATFHTTDVKLDARYLYASAHDMGGVFAYDTQGGGAFFPIASGNIWRVAVDDEGVYWGEHGDIATGTIRMLVKR